MNTSSQIYYWAHMLDECFDKEQFLCEDKEGKNINKAEKWIKQNRPELIGKEINGRVMSRARDVVTQIRHDIPSARLPYEVDQNGQKKKIKLSNGDIIDKGTCKYLLGICRIYFDDLHKKTNDQAQFVRLTSRLSDLVNVIGLQFDKDFSDDDQGRDFNGMSFDELEAKYGKYVDELKRKEREDAQSSSSRTKRNEDYKIIGIDSFDEARKFRKYVSWCVTKDESHFNDYTADGENRFYFAIRKDFKTVSEKDPSYATSMLAILVNPDGSMDSGNGCTSRLNDGGRFMTPRQVQDLLGVDFYKTFKPWSVGEILAMFKKNAIPSRIADRLGGVETKKGLHIVKNGKAQTWKKAYDGPEGKCYAYDRFFWFDTDGNEIDAPQKVSRDFDCSECTSLTSLEGAPQEVGWGFSSSGCTSLTSLEGAPLEVGGDFYCSECASLTSLKDAPQKVGGSFYCYDCASLKSLEGAPQEVGEDFYCEDCVSLTSLEGAPKEVGGDFSCKNCTSLTSLDGAPKEVDGDFNCYGCTSLTSLEGAPQKVGGNFYCLNCTSLTSLEGSPKEVGRHFYCSECASLTSLKGAPQKVGGSFNCSNCAFLTSLEGAPREVGGTFSCSGCASLTSLDGAPREVGGTFDCDNTKISPSQKKSYLAWLQKNK